MIKRDFNIIDRDLKLVKEKNGIYAEFIKYNPMYENGKKRVKRLVTAKEAETLHDLIKKKQYADAAIDNFIYLYLL